MTTHAIAQDTASARFAYHAWQFGVVAVVIAATWLGPGWGSMWGAAAALLIGRLEPQRWHVPLGLLQRTDWRKVVLLGLVVGFLLLMLVKVLLTPGVEILTGQQRDLSMFDNLRGNLHALFALLPTIWLSAGFCEEIVFRGIVLGRLRLALGGSRLATLAAIVTSCIVFALAHGYQGLSGWIIVGVMGSLFAVIYVWSGYRLWYSIALHLVYDTLSTVSLSFGWDRIMTAWGHHLFQ